MKKMTQAEFEEQVMRLINGEIGRKALAKELETDIRTLNNKITQLSNTNIELYDIFIQKFPYKPKEIEADPETLAMQVIRNGLKETAEKTGISTRTITRKVKKLQEENPELYELYQKRNNPKTLEEKIKFEQLALSYCKKELEIKIENLTQNQLQEKKKEIEDTLKRFEQLVASGMEKAKAARSLGYDDYPTIWKKYQELARIQAQEQIHKKAEESDFRRRIKVDKIPIVPKEEIRKEVKEEEEEKVKE